jgi:O-antigen ligase
VTLCLKAAAPLMFATAGPCLPLLIFFAGTLPAAAPHPSRALALIVAAVLVASLLASLSGLCAGGAAHFEKSLWAPMLSIIAAQILAICFSIAPSAGLFGLVTTLSGFILMISSAETLRYPHIRRIFLWCYLVSAIMAIIVACAISVMRLPPSMFAYEHGRASGTFLQPNEFGGFLLFVVPIGLAQIAAGRRLALLGMVASAAGAAGLVMSVSRLAIVSLLSALFFFALQFGRRAAMTYALGAATCLAALATVFRNVAHDPSENAARLAVWEGSARMIERFALTGVGPFAFHIAYPYFRLPQYSAAEVHAHSFPLQVLAEFGVLGLTAVAWFAIAAIVACARAKRSIAVTDRETNLLFSAVAVGFLASAIQNAFDVVSTFLLILIWPMLGLLLALGRPQTQAA